MGDANTILSEAEVRHVLRRTGFGAPPKEMKKVLRKAGNPATRGSLAEVLFSFKPRRYRLGGRDPYQAHNKWVAALAKTKFPVQSKLALFWHDHFATQIAVVGEVKIMARQIGLLHVQAAGNFKEFVKAMHRDAAMMEMLDTIRNRKAIPNENYAREVLELFCMGVTDLHGQPNYTQEDVSRLARAFTGWAYEWPKGTPTFRDWHHDYMAEYPERGPKVIFRSTGGFGPEGRDFASAGEGEVEIDVATDIIFEHRDSAGRNSVAAWITRRLLEFYTHDAYANPGPAEIEVIDEIIAASNFTSTWSIADLCRAIVEHDVFYETASPAPFDANTRKSIKHPIDYFVSTLRMTGVRLRTGEARVFGGSYDSAWSHLSKMGQQVLYPPSVFGWEWGRGFINSATLLARFAFSRDVTASEGSGGFRPWKLVDMDLTLPEEILDAVLDSLGIADQFGPAERTILIDYLTDGGATATLDLWEDDTKLRGLYLQVFQSPIYQMF